MSQPAIPVSAPINTGSIGTSGTAAIQSVFRIICPDINSSGTGFLHRSGKLITAEHVVRGSTDVNALLPTGLRVRCSTASTDQNLDVALLNPLAAIKAPAIPISSATGFTIGAQVTTWGFPQGYPGIEPMLAAGHLGALIGIQKAPNTIVRQWCINAAFNSGNSGGPLIDVQSGEVMGVVSSKLAPISHSAMTALNALENQKSGFMYTATHPDGTTTQSSEGQIVAQILNELRMQVQLVIGMAVYLDDLRAFLQKNDVNP